MVSRLRLTIVSSPLHAPPRDGASFFTQSTLSVLAKAGYEITLIVLQLDAGVSSSALEQTYSAQTVRRVLLPHAGAGLAAKLARWVLSIRHQVPPAQVPYLAAASRVRKVLSEVTPDAVIVLGGSAGLVIDDLGPPAVVVAFSLPTADAERAQLNAWWRRLTRRWERLLAGNATILAATTEVEAELFRERFPDHRVRSVPFAVEPNRSQPRRGTGPRLLYIGDFGYPPNVVGAMHLATQVMPAIWVRRPDVELVIAGKLSENAALEHNDPRIKRQGEYGSLAELATSDTLGILPLSAAGGVRTRAFEYAAAGIPIVATTASVEGLTSELLRGAVVVRSPEDLAEASLQQFDQPNALQKLRDAGLQAVRSHASPELAIGKWRELLDELAALGSL